MPKLTRCIPVEGDLPKGAVHDDATRLRVWLVKEAQKALKNPPEPE